MLSSGVLACGGIYLAWYYYLYRPAARTALDERFAPVANFLRNRWYVDAVFEEHFMEKVVLRTAAGAAAADSLLIDGAVRGTASLSRIVSAALGWADRFVIDGIVRAVSGITRFLSWPSRALQSGFVQTYALLFLAGVLAALGYCFSR